MVKVITYGTYDLLHYGHIRLLERAKALGDYLIVGVTTDDFDKTRGKINIQQSLMERVEAVHATGIADEIIIEEYEGQKIDDIKRYDIDIFTVGSDWIGKFDYLNEYCKVVYLPRTEGVSSSEIRSKKQEKRLGIVGDSDFLNKIETESHFVNGLKLVGICSDSVELLSDSIKKLPFVTHNYDDLLEVVDAIYLRSQPKEHYEQIKKAICAGKDILCEAPIAISIEAWNELKQLAAEHNVVLMDAIKTAYSTAYTRLLLLLKTGIIGRVVSVDTSCSQIIDYNESYYNRNWNNVLDWGPTALLPVFQILGTNYISRSIVTHYADKLKRFDDFTKIDFVYQESVASIKIGSGVKTEGEMIISGTKGYVYVPAPWWKTDYFEVRFENPHENKRYFYQLDGEGIRYELVSFMKSIDSNRVANYISDDVSKAICKCVNDYFRKDGVIVIEY